jgi:hypothetical protein
MSELSKQLEELAQVGKELAEYGYRTYGTGWHDLTSDIQSYMSSNLNHMAIKIDGVDIGFFSTPKFEITAAQIDHIPDNLVIARNKLIRLLEEEKKVLAEDADQLRLVGWNN